MATHSAHKSTSIVDAEARSRVSSSKSSTAHLKYHRQVADGSGLISSVSKHVETCQTEHKPQDFKPSTHTFHKAVGFLSLKQEGTLDYLLRLDPGSPVVLSPTESVSTTSSPGAENDIWGSPETPSLRPGGTPATEVLTPLTPPTTYDEDNDQSPIPKATKSLRTTAIRRAAATDTVAPRSIASVDIKTEELEADDYFQPKKLFRNLTKDFQASKSQKLGGIIMNEAKTCVLVTDANAAAAQENYRLKPDFNFGSSHESSNSTPSRKPKVQPRYDQSSAKSEPLLETRKPDTKSKINVVPRSQTMSKERKVLEHIVPFDIHGRLRELPGKCVASLVRRPEKRCTFRRPSQNTDIIFREISRCNIDTDITKLLSGIEALVQAVQCGHHRNVAFHQSRMGKMKKMASDLSQLTGKDRSDFRAWLEAISNPSQASDIRDTPRQELLVDEKPTISKVPVSRSPAKTSTSASPASSTPIIPISPNFSTYKPKPSKGLSEFIVQPLKPGDMKSGFIYVFWDQETFGMVKIGRTNDLGRRLKEWNKACQHSHSYHPSMRELVEIPHVNRIERLIQIELNAHRMTRTCKECSKTHIEWFQVGETHAVEVFLKWQDWILQEPYALNPRSGEWEIRPEMEHTLEAVCQPVVSPEPPKVGEKIIRGPNRFSRKSGGRDLRAR
jgi:hypothetical protein